MPIDHDEFPYLDSGLNFIAQQVNRANQQLAGHATNITLFRLDQVDPNQFRDKPTVLLTNNRFEPGHLHHTQYQEMAGSFYGIFAGGSKYSDQVPVKKFNCFMNRVDPIRQSWLYQFVRRGLFDQGLISFNIARIKDSSGVPLDNEIQPPWKQTATLEEYFQTYLQNFQVEHEQVKHLVPYKNFDCDLNQAILQSEFGVVLETYFDRNHAVTFSEKIFRHIKMPRPWLLFAMKNSVQHLRDLGFDVLDDLVDHSYDQQDFHIDRQSAMLEQMKLLCDQPWTKSRLQRCQQASIHNQQVLSVMQENFGKDIQAACDLAVIKCKNLSLHEQT